MLSFIGQNSFKGFFNNPSSQNFFLPKTALYVSGEMQEWVEMQYFQNIRV